MLVVIADQNDRPANAGVRKPIPVTIRTVATNTFKAVSTTLPIDSPTLYVLYWHGFIQNFHTRIRRPY